MIIAAFEHLGGQTPQTPAMQKAIAWLSANRTASDLAQRVEIDGKGVYALVQEYETAAAGDIVNCEAHRKYIDIQYICSGEEVMGWAPLDALRAVTDYNPDKDVLHGDVPDVEMTAVLVRSGQAAIFYPEDAHAPKLAAGKPGAVRKIVVKVRCA
jgi:biofilm protein TabA